MRQNNTKELTPLYLTVVVLTVTVIDQMVKSAVRSGFQPGESVQLFPGLQIVYSRNSGVAFGFFQGSGVVLVALGLVVVAALVTVFYYTRDISGMWLPVGLVIGGAASNIYDRVMSGSVTDYIDPSLWPAFNLADTSIVLGVVGILTLYLLYTRDGVDDRA